MGKGLKAFDFDDDGNHIGFDSSKLMKSVIQHGYHGYVGIEYEGNRLVEDAGIRLTKALLETLHSKLLSTTLSNQ